jgi:hypothetical protein
LLLHHWLDQSLRLTDVFSCFLYDTAFLLMLVLMNTVLLRWTVLSHHLPGWRCPVECIFGSAFSRSAFMELHATHYLMLPYRTIYIKLHTTYTVLVIPFTKSSIHLYTIQYLMIPFTPSAIPYSTKWYHLHQAPVYTVPHDFLLLSLLPLHPWCRVCRLLLKDALFFYVLYINICAKVNTFLW